MVTHSWYTALARNSIAGVPISARECKDILASPKVELLPLLDAAFAVRKKFFGTEVLLHIIDNVQNGLCPEDCRYCAQSRLSRAPIEQYPMKSDEEILAEARDAHKHGAFRHCMVFSGRKADAQKLERIARLVKEIKARYPMQVCVSPGIVDKKSLKMLKAAGLDRINHNINTSAAFYKNICTTHGFNDRIKTLKAATAVGLEICSGVIVGMGETPGDVVDAARTLKKFNISSIPVNFFIPIPGTALEKQAPLTPEYCLRVLCLYRLLNPRAEIRIAAGREVHLRSMEAMALYPANSLFIDGYLNTRGLSRSKTLRMIRDAGFTIKSEYTLDELLAGENEEGATNATDSETLRLKNAHDLHPAAAILTHTPQT